MGFQNQYESIQTGLNGLKNLDIFIHDKIDRLHNNLVEII
jgi:hypothetical protein